MHMHTRIPSISTHRRTSSIHQHIWIDLFHSKFNVTHVCVYGYINYRALLRKMTYKDKASYDSTPLCAKQVMFRKRATNYRALLRKMTYEDKASCESPPPCTFLPFIIRYHTCMCIWIHLFLHDSHVFGVCVFVCVGVCV